MGQIEDVEVVEEWVYRDLSSGNFGSAEQERALDGIDDLETDLVTWERPVHNVLDQIEYGGETTVYRRRAGDLRLYFIRKGETMYCIGVGKRPTTYDRDIEQISNRADNHPPD